MSQSSYQIQTQAQQLAQMLSPHQILVVKLLELPTMELEERVRSEILDNPALEEGKEIPFPVKRVYYMYDTVPGVRRGFHAHKCLEQILICIHGSCKIHLDNGRETEEVALSNPYEGLYIPNDMWREMYDFTPGTVLLVLASEHYDEADYIRDYQTFINMVHKKEELK